MSFMKHEYKERPGGIYADRCSHCGKTRDTHDVPDDVLADNVLALSQLSLHEAQRSDPRPYSEKMAEVMSAPAPEPKPKSQGPIAELIAAVTTVLLVSAPSLPTDDSSGRYLCYYCSAAIKVGQYHMAHYPDCPWQRLVDASDKVREWLG